MRRLPLRPDEQKDRNVAAVWPSTEQVIRSRPVRPRKMNGARADDGEGNEDADCDGAEGSRTER